jgi:ATP synthase F1 delta subunit
MSIAFNKISEPYAKALLEFSIAENCVGVMSKSVSILTLIIETPELNEFLNDPFISRESKKKGLKAVFLDFRILSCFTLHPGSINFLFMLIDRNRIKVLKTIGEKFRKMAWDYYSFKTVVITSAVPLKASTIAKYKVRLKGLGGAKQIFFIQKVEPALVGGLIFEMESKRIDVSIWGQLLQLCSFLGL